MRTLPPLLSLILLSAAPVTAQSADTPAQRTDQAQPEIVVEGQIDRAPLTPRERRVQLREMVTDIINIPRAGRTVATYFEGICPRVIGLPEAETRVVETRIAQNAQSLGANRRDVRNNCRPNVTVIFVPASKGPPSAWLTDDNDMLGHLLSYERNSVLSESDPVRAWTYNAARSADGAPLPVALGQPISGAQSFNNQTRFASRLRTNSTIEITGSAIMIELAAANGKTLAQLADYASMRTFGNTRGLRGDAMPTADTILTLFRSDTPPEGLTTFDRALISKMYDTKRTARARRYYSGIANRALELEQEERAARP